MRLIDFDKLMEQYDFYNEFAVHDLRYLKEDCLPFVEAIPIEWIKNYLIPFQVHHDSLSEDSKENDGAGWVIDVLETMMRDWKKENDRD